MNLHLTFNLYWLLVPALLLAVGFVYHKTHDLGSGLGDGIYLLGILALAVTGFLLFLIGLLAYHLLTV